MAAALAAVDAAGFGAAEATVLAGAAGLDAGAGAVAPPPQALSNKAKPLRPKTRTFTSALLAFGPEYTPPGFVRDLPDS
ncbi:MAG: hypothetical protein JO247_21760 [Chloroflexi bacterium]|nr:hypothetical protein [Chloroflexota bacterium]